MEIYFINWIKRNFLKKEKIQITRKIFLRLLALVYFFAIMSIFYQMQGLWGDDGIFPATKKIENESIQLYKKIINSKNLLESLEVTLARPNIFVYSNVLRQYLIENKKIYQKSEKFFNKASGLLNKLLNITFEKNILKKHLFEEDFSLTQNLMFIFSIIGIIISISIFMNFQKRIFFNPFSYLYLWFLYISIHNIGDIFMSYQWDIFLIEIGFLSIFFCPWSILNKKNASKINCLDILVYYLLRFMFFRFIYANGIVKVTANCPVWQSFTTLHHHYQSQPIPNKMSYYAHFSPDWLKKLLVAFTFYIEIHSTFLFFSFRLKYVNYFIGIIQTFLQIGIIFTGSYNFFNILTVILNISNFDDEFYEIVIPEFIINFFDLNKIRKNKKIIKNKNQTTKDHIFRYSSKLYDFISVNLVFLFLFVYICFSYVFPLKEVLYDTNYRYTTKDLKNIFDKKLLDNYILCLFIYITMVFFICFLEDTLKFLRKNYLRYIFSPYSNKQKHETKSILRIIWKSSMFFFSYILKFLIFFFLSCNFWYSNKIFYFGLGIKPNSLNEILSDKIFDNKIGNLFSDKNKFTLKNFWHFVLNTSEKFDYIFHNLQTNYSYGLFRVITGIGFRPELEIYYKSANNQMKKLNFLYKPSYDKPLKLTNIPHQPRIDWQMWFAALSNNINTEPWLIITMGRIIEKNPIVLDLMGYNIKGNPIKSNLLFEKLKSYIGIADEYLQMDDQIISLTVKKYEFYFKHFDQKNKNGIIWNKREKIIIADKIDKHVLNQAFQANNIKLIDENNSKSIKFSKFYSIPIIDYCLIFMSIKLFLDIFQLIVIF